MKKVGDEGEFVDAKYAAGSCSVSGIKLSL
jgi:hypothetical protein